MAPLAAWLVATFGAAAAEAMPVCGGRDLIAAMERESPQTYARIRAEGATLANAEANLWRIEKPNAPASYLFATVHVSDPRITGMPAAARAALSAAQTVAVEVKDVNDGTLAAAMSEMTEQIMFGPGESLSAHLSADEQVALSQAALALGTNSVMLDRMRPWFVGVMLATPACEQHRIAGGLEPLDGLIEAEAHANGAEVVGLETIAEQLGKFAVMPFEAQLANLRLALRTAAQVEDMNETLITLYREHRIGEVWPLTRVMSGDEALADIVIDEFQTRLIDERNIVMRDRALPLLDKGGAFIAVGALHLPGDKGLVALFREAGYTVTPVE
jgi:hypothetical protein